MPSVRPEIRSRRLQRAIAVVAGAVFFTGALVLVGWHANISHLVRARMGHVAVQYNTAVNFIIIALALFAASRNRVVTTRILAGVVGLIAALTLSQDVGGWDLGLNQALFRLSAGTTHSTPGRMAPATAISFILLSYSICAWTFVRRREHSGYLALPAALTMALAGTALFGYVTGLSGAYGWGEYTRMSLITGCVVSLLGMTLFGVAWSKGRPADGSSPGWLPAGVTLAGGVASLVVWYGLVIRQGQESALPLETSTGTLGPHALPTITLLAGVAASVLIGYALIVSRRAQRTAHELRLINQQLGIEIDERVRAEARLQAALAEVERQKFALDEHAIVSVTDVQGTILYANDRFCDISGYTREELIGTNHRIVRSGFHPPEYFAEMYRTIARGRVWQGEFCNRKKNGELYWVDATVVPSLGRDGKPERYIGIRTDITERKKAERRLRDALGLSEAVLSAISRVAGSPALAAGDVQALARLVTESAASVLEVERVGVWLFSPDGEAARCVDLFEATSRLHSSGQVLQRAEFGRELESLTDTSYIDAHDALHDPRTAGYRDTYLKPNGITSMLDMVIRTGGRNRGLLCFEHVGRQHRWDSREISFGCQLADQIGIAVLTQERTLAAEELVRARDAAEGATRAKSDFLAMMSHEIRTPINGVLGMNNLLLETSLDARQRQIATSINTSAESLLTIINDILDFSKIEARRLELDHVDFDLRHVLEEALEIQATRAHAKGLELAGLLEPGLEPLVRGDPGRVRQILCNLIGNAVKFTERGEVMVRAHLIDETAHELCLRFEVRDTGIGISTESQQRLFQAFAQADRSTTRRFGGTGLGLVISRQLIEMMGGEIGIVSAPGAGSTFHFTVHLEKQSKLADLERWRAGAIEGGPRRVLVVEDNTSTRQLLCEQLGAWQIAPERATTAQEAMDRLRQAAVVGGRFDCLIADLGLPGIDGLALAAEIGREPLLAGTRLILLVPLGSHRGVTPVAGIDLIAIAKPVKSAELRMALSSAAARRAGDHAAATALVEEPGHGVRVLLAEDNAINQMVASANLAKLGCTTDVAANGLEVLEAVRRAPYDIIFMDCMMPEMDGFEATTRVRELERLEHRPPVYIVALTASAMVGDRERCLAAGMDDYISKPMRGADILAAVQRWRKSRERTLEVQSTL